MANIVQIADYSAPKRSKTKSAIMRAGTQLLSEKPIDAISIDEIVDAAGVAKGSFYYHYEDKRQLAQSIADDINIEINTISQAKNKDIADPARRIIRAICIYLRFAHKDPMRARIMVRWQTDPSADPFQLNPGLVAEISKGLVSGRFKLVTAEAGVLSVLGIAGAGMRRLLAESGSLESVIAVSQQLCVYILKGLGLRDAEANKLATQATHEIFVL